MREIFSYGSVVGAAGNRCSYLDPDAGHPAVIEEWFGELAKVLLTVSTAFALHRWAVGVGHPISRYYSEIVIIIRSDGIEYSILSLKRQIHAKQRISSLAPPRNGPENKRG